MTAILRGPFRDFYFFLKIRDNKVSAPELMNANSSTGKEQITICFDSQNVTSLKNLSEK